MQILSWTNFENVTPPRSIRTEDGKIDRAMFARRCRNRDFFSNIRNSGQFLPTVARQSTDIRTSELLTTAVVMEMIAGKHRGKPMDLHLDDAELTRPLDGRASVLYDGLSRLTVSQFICRSV